MWRPSGSASAELGAHRARCRSSGATPRSARLEPEPFTVVHTGNMGLKQDLGNMVEAARLHRDRPDVAFVFMGDGSQRRALEAQAEGLPNLRFVDPLDSDEYPRRSRRGRPAGQRAGQRRRHVAALAS